MYNPTRKPQKFRSFVTLEYWSNRDEYHSYNQTQPHTFEQYVTKNLAALKHKYRLLNLKVQK